MPGSSKMAMDVRILHARIFAQARHVIVVDTPVIPCNTTAASPDAPAVDGDRPIIKDGKHSSVYAVASMAASIKAAAAM